jgi:hypothetical protein
MGDLRMNKTAHVTLRIECPALAVNLIFSRMFQNKMSGYEIANLLKDGKLMQDGVHCVFLSF